MFSITFVYAILAGILPAFIWLHFWLKEDTHPEPKTLIALSFLGGVIAVFAAVLLEKYLSTLFITQTSKFIVWAAAEEIIKLIAVAIVALNSDYNDEPIDAMIYCIAVALGFSAFENALFIFGPFSSGEYLTGIVTGNMRFVGSTLVHIVSSAIIGFSIGACFFKGYFTKIISIIIGVALAIAFHSAFNLSIVDSTGNDTIKVFGYVWVACIVLIILFEEIKGVTNKNKYYSHICNSDF